MEKIIENAVNFIKNIDGETAIIYDNDGDGISSTAIFSRVLKSHAKTVAKTGDEFFISEKIFQKIKKFNFIITLDIPFDERPYYILKLAKKSKVLVIDHHQIHKNLNVFKNVLHVNPELWQNNFPSFKYCVSKIIFDIMSMIKSIENLDWLAAIGIVNDKCEDLWKDFLDSIYEKYNIKFSDIKLANDIINSGYYCFGTRGAEIGYKACLEATSPKDIINAKTPNSRKLKILYKRIEKEIKMASSKWRKKAEIFEDKKLIILKLDTKLPINSPISTKISIEKPNYTVIVTRKKGNMTFVSLRRQDGKVNCGELAGNATRGLKNAKGGGHVPAAGASITSKEWKFFRSRILDLL